MTVSTTASSLLSSTSRVSGLSSLDTDSLVQVALISDNNKIDKTKQNNQLLEWQRDDYRSITNTLKDFSDTYFDLLNPSTDMRLQNNYKAFTTSASNITEASNSTTFASATATGDAVAGTHILHVDSLATAANATSTANVSQDLISSDLGSDPSFVSLGNGTNFNLTLNGVTKNISILQTENGLDKLQTAIQEGIKKAFGADNSVTVDVVGNALKFNCTDDRITLTSGTTDQNALEYLGITSGSTNRLKLSSTLENLNMKNLTFDSTDNSYLRFSINGKEFTFDKTTTTLSGLMNTVNSSDANVTLTYSDVYDKFTLTSKSKGTGTAINISNTITGYTDPTQNGNFFATAEGNAAARIATGDISNGTDAIFELDAPTTNPSDQAYQIRRNDNTFTIDGVTYNLDSVHTEASDYTKITINQDVDTVYNSIKTFIDKYNDVLNTLNTKVSETRYRDYLPLTNDQRDAMNDTDITAWETKAKSGLLRDDSMLTNIVYKMREAIYNSINDVSGNMSSIGIGTSSYTDNGKLTIDEKTLKDAIRNTPDKVTNLFAKSSSIDYSASLSSADRQTRYNDSGIVNRLDDILQDSIRTTRDSNGYKGNLLEKAGMVGDVSEFTSTIVNQINANATLISTLIDNMTTKQSELYQKYSTIESALAKMSNQAASLTQTLG